VKIKDFLDDELFNIPKEQSEKEDFKIFISKTFKNLILKLKSLKSKNIEFDNLNFPLETIIERQIFLVKKIEESIDSYYNGKPREAYNKLISGLNSNLKNYQPLLNIRNFKINSDFYRLRYNNENYPLPSEKMFHIPYELRGKVKTQRFSIPGFPSLYLGTTVYVCWEELNRPNLNEFQAVRLKSVKPIKVVDLSPPSTTNQTEYNYYKYLMTWPLVFASSVKVRNVKDEFKPEYIIPQLLLQWVRENEEIDGIAYQTTHIDTSKKSSKGEFINLVLPVRENKTKGLCKQLQQKFEMTKTTSIQLIETSSGGTKMPQAQGDDRLNEKIERLELIDGVSWPYGFAKLGNLEYNLLHMKTFT
jgi:hypothetical protein